MHTSWGIRALVAGGAAASLVITPAVAQAAARAGTIIQVDVAADGTPGDGDINSMDVANGGRRVAFTSNSSNLVADDWNETYDVFVRDLDTGSTTLVNGTINGQPADGYSEGVAISGKRPVHLR